MDLVFHRADLQTLQILRRVNSALGVCKVAKSVFRPGEPDEVMILHLLEHLLPDLAVQYAPGMFIVAKQKGKIEDQNVGYKIAEGTAGGDYEIDRADLQPLNHIALSAQCAARVFNNGELAIGKPFQSFLEGCRTVTVVRVLRQ